MTEDADSADVVIVRRVLRAPRARVFAAWLDPAMLAQFMRPGPIATATAAVDPRVGGAFRIVMRHGDREHVHWGEYLRIEPPWLLSFTWISDNTDRRPTIVTVELVEHEGGTALTLTHRGLPPSQVKSHREGWTDIGAALQSALGTDNGLR
jgi:uncharacterized protein YndB with AHSA1/START domain